MRKAIHKLTGVEYAIKIIPYSDHDDDDEDTLMNEVNILKSLVIYVIFP